MIPKRKRNRVDYDLPYSGTTGRSMDREIARRKWESRATPEERELGSVLTRDSEGNYIRRTRLSSPAEYDQGGKIPGNPFSLPAPVLGALLSSFFKGEEEKPIILRETGDEPEYQKSYPRWWPTDEDVKEWEDSGEAKKYWDEVKSRKDISDTTRSPMTPQERVLMGLAIQALTKGKR